MTDINDYLCSRVNVRNRESTMDAYQVVSTAVFVMLEHNLLILDKTSPATVSKEELLTSVKSPSVVELLPDWVYASLLKHSIITASESRVPKQIQIAQSEAKNPRKRGGGNDGKPTVEDAKTPDDWVDEEYPNGDRPHRSLRWVLIEGVVKGQKYIGNGAQTGQWRDASIGGVFPGDDRSHLSARKPKGGDSRSGSVIIPQSDAKKTDNGAKAQALLTSQQAENAILKETIRALVGDLSTAQDRASRREQTYREMYRAAVTQVKTLQGKIKSSCRISQETATQFGYDREQSKFEDDDEDMIACKVEERMKGLPAELILKRKRVAFMDGDAGSSGDSIPLKRAMALSPSA